jgi:hypothetical protein
MPGAIVRDPYGRGTIAVTAYGGSWICDHVKWRDDDGLVIVPLPADVAQFVPDLSVPVDMDAIDRQRLINQIQDAVDGINFQTYTVVRSSIHECFRVGRLVVYLGRVRPHTFNRTATDTALATDVAVVS